MIFMTRTPRFTVNGDEKIRFFYMSVFCPRAVGEEIARAPNDVRGLLSPPARLRRGTANEKHPIDKAYSRKYDNVQVVRDNL